LFHRKLHYIIDPDARQRKKQEKKQNARTELLLTYETQQRPSNTDLTATCGETPCLIAVLMTLIIPPSVSVKVGRFKSACPKPFRGLFCPFHGEQESDHVIRPIVARVFRIRPQVSDKMHVAFAVSRAVVVIDRVVIVDQCPDKARQYTVIRDRPLPLRRVRGVQYALFVAVILKKIIVSDKTNMKWRGLFFF
jgi:hypothetical protein